VEEMIDDDKLEILVAKAIDDNMTITDLKLYDAVYSVGLAVATAVIEAIKESPTPKKLSPQHKLT